MASRMLMTNVLSQFRNSVFQQNAFSVAILGKTYSSELFSSKSNLQVCSRKFYGCAARVGTELARSGAKGKCALNHVNATSILSIRGMLVVQHARNHAANSCKRHSGHQFNSSAHYSTGPNVKKAKALLIATYVSGAIGIAMLTAVGFRFYGRFRMRARGIEELDVPHYPRRSRVLARYRGFNLPTPMVNTVVNEIPWFEVRSDDVWVASYPKAGTTWLQEIVYLLCNDLDFERAKAAKVDERFPYLEFPFPGLKEISKLDSPRFIKTHLPFSLLPKQLEEKKPKVIYIARNPKDTVVSLQAFQDLTNYYNFTGTLDDFAQNFLDGLCIYGPWTKHVQEGWEQRNKDHVLFVTYEDLHRDFRGTVKEIAGFLGRSMSDGELDALQRHCSFSSMKTNDSVNYSWMKGIWKEGHFMRKGEVGDWKQHLSAERSGQFDTMTVSLQALGLQFIDS